MRVWVMVMTLAMASNARAQSISFGSTQDVYVGTTTGLFVTHDAGATWHWMCANAVGYSGNYIPDYQGSSTSVFATTFDGAKVTRDGCTFDALPTGTTFVSQIERAANGDIWMAASDPADSKLYKSTDDGMTFPTSVNVATNGDWWQSMIVSNLHIPWESGFHLDQNNAKTFLLAMGGSQMQTSAFTTTPNSQLEIVAVRETDRYVRVNLEDDNGTSSLYHGNDTNFVAWQKIRTKPTPFSFLLRKDGTILVATGTSLESSADQGATWTPITCAPSGITCLAESPTGELWACTSESTVVRTTDMKTWSFALNPHDVAGPVACNAGTIQHDTCEPQWTTVDAQLDAITLTMPPVCMDPDAPPVSGDTTMNPETGGSGGGCCSGAEHPGSSLLLATSLLALSRTRRPRRRDP